MRAAGERLYEHVPYSCGKAHFRQKEKCSVSIASRIGEQFGHYEPRRLIKATYFSEVYEASHPRLGQVALKLLKTQLDERGLRTFLNEMQAMRLRHPHIIEILRFGVEGQTPFLAMPYYAAGSLRERLQDADGGLSPVTIVKYVRQLAEALQFAHEQGIIHRDVKPENVLVASGGKLVLADFGIAVVFDQRKTHQNITFAGTAEYAPPEQFQDEVSEASDQYALGTMVYEWLSGDVPFHADAPFAMYIAKSSRRPPDLDGVAAAVKRVVMRALAIDPHKRFPDVPAFATALEKAIWLEEGKKHFREHRYADALASFEQAIQQYPRFAQAHYWKAQALYHLNRLEEAQSAAEGTIRLNPHYGRLFAGNLVEAVNALDERAALFWSDVLNTAAGPAARPELWVRIAQSLGPLPPPALSWQVRSRLLSQWNTVHAQLTLDMLAGWLEVSWEDVEGFFQLGLSDEWNRVMLTALFRRQRTLLTPEQVRRCTAYAQQFEQVLSALLADPLQSEVAIRFFARMARANYTRKIPLLAALVRQALRLPLDDITLLTTIARLYQASGITEDDIALHPDPLPEAGPPPALPAGPAVSTAPPGPLAPIPLVLTPPLGSQPAGPTGPTGLPNQLPHGPLEPPARRDRRKSAAWICVIGGLVIVACALGFALGNIPLGEGGVPFSLILSLLVLGLVCSTIGVGILAIRRRP